MAQTMVSSNSGYNPYGKSAYAGPYGAASGYNVLSQPRSLYSSAPALNGLSRAADAAPGTTGSTQPAQISPTSSTTSSSSSVVMTSPVQSQASSPTSTRSFYSNPPPPPQHLRSLKRPLYRPAVLRYGTSLKVNGKDWSHQLFWGHLPPVTGAPKRAHWVSDDSVDCCLDCKKAFTFWDRRHHCRRCGMIFCAAHSSHALRLDQNCNFHPAGMLSRTCDKCAGDFNRHVIDAVNSRNNDGTLDALETINRINNMVSNGNKAVFPGAGDEDDVLTALTTEGVPVSSVPHSEASSAASSLPASEIDPMYTDSINGDVFARQRQLQQLQNQQPMQQVYMPDAAQAAAQAQLLAAVDDRKGDVPVGSVPADWSWSTF
ncbi:uncharacterized protein V1510DRAFT_418699 [Dipodascopsis tothii]|uniref:uncharacterized protein n=1 Tax=Dipodascopsis tothii TaxID=44089 RepID=UPI0034CE7A73